MSDSDSDDSDLDLLITSIIVSRSSKTRKRLKRKKYWVNPYLLDRSQKGRFFKDLEDMRAVPKVFFENFHVTPKQFDNLLMLIEPSILPSRCTRPLDIINFSHPDLFLHIERHIASVYRVSKQRFGTILEEVCEALYVKLKPTVFKDLSEKLWRNTANDFNSKWNMPNCVGSIDGKHVPIKCPPNAQTNFFNYKGFHSIVLMAAADADCKFIYFDVGAYGSEADGQVFRTSDLGTRLASGTLRLPDDIALYGKTTPYYFVADDAFPLQRTIMKPYRPPNRSTRLADSEKIFNYRLSRARRIVENCFGILCARWICLGRTLFVSPSKAQKIVSACCALHNYCMSSDKQYYSPPGFADSLDELGNVVEGSWRQLVNTDSIVFNQMPKQNAGRTPLNAKAVRDHIKSYLNSETGSVSWQLAAVHL